jgi:hypothetical protein
VVLPIFDITDFINWYYYLGDLIEAPRISKNCATAWRDFEYRGVSSELFEWFVSVTRAVFFGFKYVQTVPLLTLLLSSCFFSPTRMHTFPSGSQFIIKYRSFL